MFSPGCFFIFLVALAHGAAAGNKKTVALLSKMTKACDYDGFVLQSKRASTNGCAISSFTLILPPRLLKIE